MRLPGEGVVVLLDAQLVQRHVVGLLLPDVLGDRRLVQPDGRYAAALAPELAVAELVLQVAVPLEHHEGALPLQVAHEARNAHLGRDAHQHVHMVGHQMPLYYLHALVGAEPAQYLPHALPVLVVDDLSSILRCEHDVVLAEPPRVRQAVRLLRHIVAFLPISDDLSNHHCRGKGEFA